MMSQIPYLYHRRLPADQWVDVVEGIHQQSRFKYLYAEEPATIHLIAFQQPSPDWPDGRAFGQAMELRWSRRRDGQVDLTLLSEKPLANGGDWQRCNLSAIPKPDDELSVKDEQIMLLGVSRRHPASPYHATISTAPKEWTDSRIPRPLKYPLPEEQANKRWVKVVTKTYCLDDRPVITRLVALEGSDDDETKKL